MVGLDTKEPPDPVFRIGRKPNPWQPPDWSRANPDRTFGNRFDDPKGYYRVLYAATQLASCFVETLARFRPDFTLLAELQEIEGEDDFFPQGGVPLEWCGRRLIGVAAVTGNYADICCRGWVEYLREKMADECLKSGFGELDAGALRGNSPRRITQLASLHVYELGLPGIYYRSRFAHDFENWALFEPFRIARTHSRSIHANDPTLQQALHLLGLELGA